MRMCAGCGARRPKSEMIRVAADRDGNVSVTGERGASGRGAYLCPEKRCLEISRGKGGIRRGLKASIPDAIYEELELLTGGQRGTSG
ncbi:MAG: YlxR family protein [Actinobacteria bacterium]|nr:YlxR family protein [Actinomycetota bacterium]